jgi:hypothetical protein
MQRMRSISLGCALIALTASTAARAGQLIIIPGAQNQVEADVLGGLFNAPVGGALTPIPNAGLTFLKAFSQTKGPPVATNDTVTTSLTGAANPTFKQLPAFATGTFIPVPKKPKGYNFVGPPVIMTGGPIIPFRNPQGYGQPKGNIATAGSAQTIVSNTGPYYGAAGQFNVGGRKFTAAGAANTMPFGIGPAGTAAGSAYDPYSVTPGNIYGYSPEIDVHLDPAAGETGGVHLFALDTNSAADADSFDQDGEPVSEDLWTLDITEDSSGKPVVDFEMNPGNPADSEIAFALPYLQSVDPADCMSDPSCEVDKTASVDAAIDKSEDSAIEAAFVDAAGDDLLTDFSLFGTYNNGGVITDIATYTPSCAVPGCTIEYGDGVDAGLDAPEPATLTLFGVTLAGLAIVRRRAF